MSHFSVLPESVRWQLSKNKIKEAKRTIYNIARSNGTQISEDILGTLTAEKADDSAHMRKYTFIDLLRPTKMLTISLNVWFNWLASILNKVFK